MEYSEPEDLTASVTINLAGKMTSGGYSDVYRGRLATGGDRNSIYVAVKLPRYAQAQVTEKIIRDVKNEIALWSKLEHPNVLPLLGIYFSDSMDPDILPGAVSPWCDGGTLLDYLKSERYGYTMRMSGSLHDRSFALLCLEVELLSQATSGLEYLHAHNIIHGDLKACNILVQDGVARLCDFGYSVLVLERLGGTSTRLGTPRWFASEFLEEGARRTREADVWGLGCVILEAFTFELPYHDRRTDQAVHTALHGRNVPYTYPPNMNMKLWRIAGECWSWGPSTRPKAQAISARLIDMLASLRQDTGRADGIPLLCGHEDNVYSVAFLFDGRRLISSSKDRTLRIWDIETRKTVIGPLEGHSNIVRCVAVHGSRIASCSPDETFRVWDADSGKLILGPIPAHNGEAVFSIGYSRDGTRIATAGEDNRAAIWDANTGVQLQEMIGHTSCVMCVAFSEDGTRLVSGSWDKTVRIWDVASGECIGEPLNGHTAWVSAVCFSPDDKHIFSSSIDCTIRIWNAETKAVIVEPLRMDDQVLCMALSPDGKRLVSGSYSGKIAIWNAETGTVIPTVFRDQGYAVWGVAFSPDGRKIASASEDKTITLWDVTDDWKRWDIDDEDVEKSND